MYSSQLQLKFSNVSEAKIAAQSLCELLKSRISVFDFHGLQVTVGKDGDLSISVRFQDVKAMNDFEKDIPKIIEDIKQAFLFKFTKFTGVLVVLFMILSLHRASNLFQMGKHASIASLSLYSKICPNWCLSDLFQMRVVVYLSNPSS